MSELNPTVLTKEQHDEVDRIEHLPRKERRKLGKAWHVKISGKNQPLVNNNNVFSQYGKSR